MFATGLQIGPFRSSTFNGVALHPNTAALASARPQAASKLSIRAAVKMAEGIVVSDKMAKTVAVEVRRYQVHPKYGKRYRVTKKYIAHDENEECEVGDYVQLAQIAPMSKRKTWKMAKILKKVVKI